MFSLTCDECTITYNQLIELIIPLLYCMPNIEELCLDILINYQTIFIDDNHIKNYVVNQLLKLKKLEINISYEINFPLTDD